MTAEETREPLGTDKLTRAHVKDFEASPDRGGLDGAQCCTTTKAPLKRSTSGATQATELQAQHAPLTSTPAINEGVHKRTQAPIGDVRERDCGPHRRAVLELLKRVSSSPGRHVLDGLHDRG
ncbi:hypothetical protein, partial [Streptomyces sp. NPDC002346]